MCVDAHPGGDFYTDGMILFPREMSTHYSVVTFIGVYSGDVKVVWFWFLGRCLDGLILVPREMSGCFGLGDWRDVNMVRF